MVGSCIDSVDAGTRQLGMVNHFPALRAVTGGANKMNANVMVRWVQKGAAESCASGDYNYDDAILGQSLTLSTSGTLELILQRRLLISLDSRTA